ncbi:MAG: pirin-like C-terminal cupin domain-containing protein [Geminicoccaceae bacterium]
MQTCSELFYADAELAAAGTSLPLDAQQEERALYLVEGQIEIAGWMPAPAGRLCSGRATASWSSAVTPARLMLLGGAALEGPRYIWWNFVSSRKERIEDAKEAWRRQRMGVVPGETELIAPPDGRRSPTQGQTVRINKREESRVAESFRPSPPVLYDAAWPAGRPPVGPDLAGAGPRPRRV